MNIYRLVLIPLAHLKCFARSLEQLISRQRIALLITGQKEFNINFSTNFFLPVTQWHLHLPLKETTKIATIQYVTHHKLLSLRWYYLFSIQIFSNRQWGSKQSVNKMALPWPSQVLPFFLTSLVTTMFFFVGHNFMIRITCTMRIHGSGIHKNFTSNQESWAFENGATTKSGIWKLLKWYIQKCKMQFK